MDKKKLYTISLGCPKNLVDTETMLGSLNHLCVPISSAKDADIILINTCAFIEDATQESIDTIIEIIEEIKNRDNKPVFIVTGCLVNRYYKDLLKELPEVDLFLPIGDQHKLKEIVARYFSKKPLTTNMKRIISTPPSYGYLKIAEGCNNRCSFCIIPKIRGPLRSFPQQELIDQAKYILSTGRKEIVVVAQDVTSYGKDLQGKNSLYTLLEGLSKLEDLVWLRLLYLYPKGITEDFLKFLKEITPPFIPYFDIPLQHSHPEILKKMGRPFQVGVEEIVQLIRKYFENAVVRTSFIVGFPGEENEHFHHLVRFVEKMKFHHVGIFSYSAEEGTVAAKYSHHVPEDVKEERKQIIMEIQKTISRNHLKSYKGKRLKILIDKKSSQWPTLYEGRPWFFAPEIDGTFYVSGEKIGPGDMVDVAVQDTYDYDLSGII
ncbi:30S ribosomal protein S12 methylthiotransferase RimO [Desulfothermus okinawensis JCM 13304]